VGGDLVVDGRLALAEADLGVAQPARLSTTGAAVGHEVQHRVQVGVVLGGVIEELRELLLGPDHDRSGYLAGGLPPLHPLRLPDDG
jgi:hypothetical protein